MLIQNIVFKIFVNYYVKLKKSFGDKLESHFCVGGYQVIIYFQKIYKKN
jgi:hypothetical protein